ncbi:MAG TPA: class II glutamine amidotransferase [Burkholderiaceae bacterium]|nr:class II glutamine amidotransferase [Burkholderiaceae bacterium]
MCELLAMSASRPARPTVSLRTLASHGAPDAASPDGWGVAFYQGDHVVLHREAAPAGDSALVRELETGGPSTPLALSHIRRATQGAVTLANTQPFVRELAGRTHVFAHNGNLPGVLERTLMPASRYRPEGQTDSERVFCDLMERLGALWNGAFVPPLQDRLSLLAAFAAELRPLGPANFLYADGDALFAHGHRRIQRESGRIEPPGLWLLQRHCKPGDPFPDCPAIAVRGAGPQTVMLVASVPLTTQAWRPLAEGELVAIRAGEVVATAMPVVS